MSVLLSDVCVVFFFFFFKQKTAYEMRISDWSSDVCSSDLDRHPRRPRQQFGVDSHHRASALAQYREQPSAWARRSATVGARHTYRDRNSDDGHRHHRSAANRQHGRTRDQRYALTTEAVAADRKSTTSELQSLMRISYAVF